jgi:Raf kinase inhibitor-like YbhB/YbcL family protein
MPFALKSPDFSHGQPIPEPFTGDGEDDSPRLEWSAPPSGTKSFTLIVDDPDAPRGTFVHWVLANLPSDRQSLPGKVTSSDRPDGLGGAVNGKNDFGRNGYGGPKPPPGGPHRYFFKLYALDTVLPVQAGATKADVERAMKGHVLGQTELMGTYRHR